MWPDLLPDMLQKMRCHVNKTTGFSPYEMMFGRIPRLPLDLMLGREKIANYKCDLPKQIAKIN
jgi:hypothetical protein